VKGYLAALLSVLVVALTVVACGGDDDSASESADTTTKSSAAVQLPAKFASDGVISVATSADNPPLESLDTDGKTVIGFDADLAAALGEVTGTEFEFANIGFDSLLPALQAGKHDIGIVGISDTKERQEAGFDFVDYLKAGSNLLVPKGNPDGVEGLEDLCGKVVAAQKATVQADLIESEAKKHCEGKPPMDLQVYTDLTDVSLAVDSGRADAALAQSINNQTLVQKQSDKFETTGPEYLVVKVGIVIPKENAALVEPLRKAVQELIDNGTYERILADWNLVECCALDKATVNDALE
jgi:polar amino acid transport system substrate-binding protein